MEFHEKLQELRKSRGMTQEELAEELYVSRTDISIGLNIVILIFMVLSREVYAAVLLIMMLAAKVLLLLKSLKSGA